MIVASQGNLAIVKMLIQYGSDLSLKAKVGYTLCDSIVEFQLARACNRLRAQRSQHTT